jgi:hypothetical protein
MGPKSFLWRKSTLIATTDTTKIVTTAAPLWIADGWSGSGGTLAVTLADHANGGAPEIDVLFFPVNPTHQSSFQRASGPTIVTITGPAVTRWRWDTTPLSGAPRWRYLGPGSLYCDPAKTSIASLLL